MASYQRVALFLLFDSIEQDLVRHIRALAGDDIELTEAEQDKASRRIMARAEAHYDPEAPTDVLQGLDIAEKYDVLMRHKDRMPESDRAYFAAHIGSFKAVVPVRNSVMHARPLTIDEYSRGFSFAQTLLRSRSIWPTLAENYISFNKDPASYTTRAIEFLEDPGSGGVLHNLPTPEHDDTGFLPRPELERELKRRILGRHPVITILGEGGNGKTALALQSLYGLVATNDHPFDAIVWVSAKTSMLTINGIKRIGDDVVAALSLIETAASFEPGEQDAYERLYKLLEENRILLVIDNLETVQGDELKRLAEDVPGDSKLLLTSRVPLGSDLSIQVGELSEKDALVYVRRLLTAYEVRSLRQHDDAGLLRYLKRLHYKPLLIKWFVLGVKSGANPDSIVANPEVALRFCLENVIGRMGDDAKVALIALATLKAPLSAQLLEYVTPLDPRQVEVALNELARFGLVDLVVSQGSEQLYRLRPFARSYAIRVMVPKPELTNEIRARYAQIESRYQTVRGQSRYNPYSLKNYTVRSPAEMLASTKLSRAVISAMNGDFDHAAEVIEAVRISDPGYFEVHRTLAYIAYLQGDALTSSTAYEAAIELAPDQPQLHFFHANMLMRGIDSELADVHFRRAIELDPESFPSYREAARNCFVTMDLERADELLSKAGQLGFRSYKDKVVYNDLRIQVYTRTLSHRVQARDWDSSLKVVSEFAGYLYQLDLSIVDARMAEHVADARPSLSRLIDAVPGEAALARDLSEWIGLRFGGNARWASFQPSTATGSLKPGGRQERFGFLRADDGRETFVHESDAGDALWRAMLNDARVIYDIVDDGTGRTRASNLREA